MVGPLGAVKPSHGTGRPEGRPTNTGLDQYCTSFRQSYGDNTQHSNLRFSLTILYVFTYDYGHWPVYIASEARLYLFLCHIL